MNLAEELAGRRPYTITHTEDGEVEVWIEQSSDGDWVLQAGILRGDFMHGLREGEPVRFIRGSDRESGIRRMQAILEAYFPELKMVTPRSAWERL